MKLEMKVLSDGLWIMNKDGDENAKVLQADVHCGRDRVLTIWLEADTAVIASFRMSGFTQEEVAKYSKEEPAAIIQALLANPKVRDLQDRILGRKKDQ
jgi:hypothetical protein